jgi:hypothetical protein
MHVLPHLTGATSYMSTCHKHRLILRVEQQVQYLTFKSDIAYDIEQASTVSGTFEHCYWKQRDKHRGGALESGAKGAPDRKSHELASMHLTAGSECQRLIDDVFLLLRMYPVGSGGSGGRRRAADVAHFVLLHSCEVYESVPELVLTQGGPQPGPAHCKFAPTVPKKKKKLVPRALLRRRRNEML